MIVCPFCKGRATKLASLTTGLLTCQQCDQSFGLPGFKEAIDDVVARASAELLRRFLYGEGTSTPVGLLGSSPLAGAEAPAASEAGLSLRARRERARTGAISSGAHSRNRALPSSAGPNASQHPSHQPARIPGKHRRR